MAYARQCLFISLVQDLNLPDVHEAVEILMDLFGNIKLRKKSASYLHDFASKFSKSLADLPSKVIFALNLKCFWGILKCWIYLGQSHGSRFTHSIDGTQLQRVKNERN